MIPLLNSFLKTKPSQITIQQTNPILIPRRITKTAQIFQKTTPIIRYQALSFTILAVLLISILFSGIQVNAAAEDQKVYDNYGLFSETEVTDLENICNQYGEEGKVDIAIVTTDDLEGKTYKQYLEDFYDVAGLGYDKEFGDTAIILISMEPDNHFVGIQGYGNAEYYINNDRTEHILDDITPLLKDSRFYDAMEKYAEEVAYYMNEEEGVDASNPVGSEDSGNYYGESSYDGPSNYYGEEDSIFYNTFVQLGIAILIGGVTVLIMAINSGGRVTVHNRTYMDEQNSGVVARHDDYIRTTTTRVKKPSNNNGGGGGRSSGGGGISSGGHSHSGGGRSF